MDTILLEGSVCLILPASPVPIGMPRVSLIRRLGVMAMGRMGLIGLQIRLLIRMHIRLHINGFVEIGCMPGSMA